MLTTTHSPSLDSVAYPQETDAKAELMKLQEEIELAKENHMSLLAPQSFQLANFYYQQTQQLLEKNSSRKELLHSLGLTRAYLNRGLNLISIARKSIPDLVKARQEALDADAKLRFEERFQSADSRLKKIGESYESGDFEVTPVEKKKIRNLYVNLTTDSLNSLKSQQSELAR